MKKYKWVEINDGWFTYHYCTNCGYKHFDPDNPLPQRCPKCHTNLIRSNNNEN